MYLECSVCPLTAFSLCTLTPSYRCTLKADLCFARQVSHDESDVRRTKVCGGGPLQRVSQASGKIKGRRHGHKLSLTLIGWKDEVSSLPCYRVEYYSTTLFTFCWLRLVTMETARHCRPVAESTNAQNNSGRRATRLVAQSISWP